MTSTEIYRFISYLGKEVDFRVWASGCSSSRTLHPPPSEMNFSRAGFLDQGLGRNLLDASLEWPGRLPSFSQSPCRGWLRNGRDVDQPGDCIVRVLCGFFSSGAESLAVPTPAVVQQTDIFLPPEFGVPRLEVSQMLRRVPRPEGFLP